VLDLQRPNIHQELFIVQFFSFSFIFKTCKGKGGKRGEKDRNEPNEKNRSKRETKRGEI
jgi:hypothetical protein